MTLYGHDGDWSDGGFGHKGKKWAQVKKETKALWHHDEL